MKRHISEQSNMVIEEIKPIAIAIIELRLSEVIIVSQSSQSAENSVNKIFLKNYVTLVEGI